MEGGGMTIELTGLEDRVAVVTGAGRMRSIGRSIAVELASAGCHLALTSTGHPDRNDRPDEAAANWRNVDSVADEIRDLRRRAITIPMNIADPGDCERLADAVIGEYGRIDILVNSAAAPRGRDHATVVEMPIEAWRQDIE